MLYYTLLFVVSPIIWVALYALILKIKFFAVDYGYCIELVVGSLQDAHRDAAKQNDANRKRDLTDELERLNRKIL